MVMMASQCPDLDILVVDISEERISAWNSSDSSSFPIYEPGLAEAVTACRGRNLRFSTEVESAITECDIIFVCVNTPTKTSGMGAGRAANLGPWEAAGRTIARCATSNKIVVEKSTVPVRTAEALGRVLEESSTSEANFVILSNPEFLAEGTAMSDLASPDRVLIGAPSTQAGTYASTLLVNIYTRWVGREKIISTNLWSSELSKLAANAFLAQRVSSINAVAMICEATGADVEEVALAVGTDSRIGNRFLKASVGFGGSCFKKDILSLVYLCEQLGLHSVAAYWQQVVDLNELQKKSFVEKIVASMFTTVAGKAIAVFGFAFKNNTSDTRESPAIAVCSQLMDEGAKLTIYDPRVSLAQIRLDLEPYDGRYEVSTNLQASARKAHAIIVLTDWDEFRDVDYKSLYDAMEKPAFVFDGRNIVDHQKLKEFGFVVKAIGKSLGL